MIKRMAVMCIFVTSEAEGRASSTENKGKSWVWATGRPAGRPAGRPVVTLLRDLYLWNRKPDWQAVNRKPDWQAVFFGGYPHPFCRVWDQCRIMPVPTVARGACYLGGCHKCSRLLFLGNGWADCVEIWHALGDPLVTAYAVVTGGVSLHVRTRRNTPYTALLYLRNGLTDCVQIWVCGLGVIS